ncbi:MAG: hypothetical protein K2W85_09840 [Phycisphaerales bacterium]|nr:hypothetical protein [Phycisphaerales bacterium]
MIDELSAFIRLGLRAGFQSEAAIEEAAIENFGDEYGGDDLARCVKAMMSEFFAELDAERLSWPAVTDCDRLDASFEELNAIGIMARHDWWCCNTCGSAAMPDEYARLGGLWGGTPIVGYVFYHRQQTESAVEGGGIFLGYGTTDFVSTDEEYQERSVRIAHMAQKVFESHELAVTWDGTFERKLFVDLRWQRRSRPKRFCEGDDAVE